MTWVVPYETSKTANAARTRALRRLGQAHPDELLALIDQERARVGLPPLGVSGRGRRSQLRPGGAQ